MCISGLGENEGSIQVEQRQFWPFPVYIRTIWKMHLLTPRFLFDLQNFLFDSFSSSCLSSFYFHCLCIFCPCVPTQYVLTQLNLLFCRSWKHSWYKSLVPTAFFILKQENSLTCTSSLFRHWSLCSFIYSRFGVTYLFLEFDSSVLLLTFCKFFFLMVYTASVFVFVPRIFLLFSLSLFHCPFSYKFSTEVCTLTWALFFVKQAMGFSGGSGMGKENRKKEDKPVASYQLYQKKANSFSFYTGWRAAG